MCIVNKEIKTENIMFMLEDFFRKATCYTSVYKMVYCKVVQLYACQIQIKITVALDCIVTSRVQLSNFCDKNHLSH